MVHSQNLSEKRRFPFRPETRNLVYFCIFGENGRITVQGMGKTLNISRGGVLLEIHAPIPQDCRMQLSIGIGDDILELEAFAAHIQKKDTQVLHVGMAFLPMTGPQARLLSLFIERFEAERE